MNTILDTVLQHWRRGKSSTSGKGWITNNAVCCIHNGETQDKRGRGGIKTTDNGGFNYHCFNCGFKSGWQPGWHIGFKMRNLMKWMNIPEDEVKRMMFEAIRIQEEVGYEYIPRPEKVVNFKPREMPEKAKPISDWLNWYGLGSSGAMEKVPDALLNIIVYADQRGLNSDQIEEMWWTPEPGDTKMDQRLIIPYTWDGKLIGYSARAISGPKVTKYFSQYDPDYVYGLDNQLPDGKMALVMEGPLDAKVINGVAVLGSEINDTQAELIEQLNREIIVVPDRGKAGQKLIDAALKYGWSVSLPEWADEEIDDVNKAVVEYGKIFVMKKILDSKETFGPKIELLRKKYV